MTELIISSLKQNLTRLIFIYDKNTKLFNNRKIPQHIIS